MGLTIAGAQIPVTEDVAANVKTLCRAIEFAADNHADLLLTPEGSLSGYHAKFEPDDVRAGLEEVTSFAAGRSVGLALGTCFVEPDDGKCYNQLRLYDAGGSFIGFHSKILRCGDLDDPSKGEINDYATTPLRTFKFKGVTIGALICNDMWANPVVTTMDDPHLATQLGKLGAQVIVHGVNGGSRGDSLRDRIGRAYHAANLPLRARAAGVPIVTVDNCHPLDGECSSPSGVVLPDGSWAHRCSPRGEDLFTYNLA